MRMEPYWGHVKTPKSMKTGTEMEAEKKRREPDTPRRKPWMRLLYRHRFEGDRGWGESHFPVSGGALKKLQHIAKPGEQASQLPRVANALRIYPKPYATHYD
jgi:hypothetical protein